MAKNTENVIPVPAPVTIDTAGMDPNLLAALQAAMAKDGGKSLMNSVASLDKNAAATRVADHAARNTAKYMKEKFPTVYAEAYEWNKAVASALEKEGKLKKAKA
jgi:hypothetical protein